ncbi:hypothetical protein OSTOST_21686, partial [Ostertagia ostertagi]
MGAKQPRADSDDEEMDDMDEEQEQFDKSRSMETEEQPRDNKQGETYSWRRLGERLLASINRKDEEILQSKCDLRQEWPPRNDGPQKHRRRDSQGESDDGATGSSRCEMMSESQFSLSRRIDPSANVNPSSEMWEVVKAILKAQAAVNVEKYTGKNSLSDFLRTFDIKYPRKSWSNRERRDILVTLLDGPAKLMYSNLPKGVQEGSFEDVVEALEKSRRDPCRKLKKVEEWDKLRKRDNETVEEFCYKMERISREIHSDSDRDFLLGSKLQTCLS